MNILVEVDMKQQISPAVAVVVILVLVGIVAFAWTRFSGVQMAKEEPPPGGMRPEIAKEWEKYTKGQGGSNAPSGTATIPGSSGPGR
jgi:hypothetical protein